MAGTSKVVVDGCTMVQDTHPVCTRQFTQAAGTGRWFQQGRFRRSLSFNWTGLHTASEQARSRCAQPRLACQHISPSSALYMYIANGPFFTRRAHTFIACSQLFVVDSPLLPDHRRLCWASASGAALRATCCDSMPKTSAIARLSEKLKKQGSPMLSGVASACSGSNG
jgi:hypothetical protein